MFNEVLVKILRKGVQIHNCIDLIAVTCSRSEHLAKQQHSQLWWEKTRWTLISHSHACTFGLYIDSASHILFDVNVSEISVEWFSTFLSQSVLSPMSTLAFAMSPSPTRLSNCTRLSKECRMVSQILTSRLFEGRFCWRAMESSNPWFWYKLFWI